MSPLKAGIAVLFSGLCLLLCLSRSDPVEMSLLVGLLILGAVIVELTSLPLDRGRVFSLAGPLYLAVAWLPKLGPSLALFTMLAALTLRSLSPRAPTNAHKTFGFLADFSTVSIAIGLPFLLRKAGILGGDTEEKFANFVIYLLLDFWITSLLSDDDGGEVLGQQLRLTPLKFGAFMMAPLALVLSRSNSLLVLLIVPILLALNHASRGFLQGDRARRVALAEKKAYRAERAQHEIGSKLALKERDLKRQLSERELLEALGRAFVNTPDLRAVCEHAIQVIRQVVHCQSVAFFLNEGESLEPRYYQSPHDERVRTARKLGLTETVVERCWQERKPVILNSSADSEKRIFSGELSGVTFPIGRVGVIYIGCTGNKKLDRETLRDLAVVADQTLLAAVTALQRDELKEALGKVERANVQLEESRRRLESVLEAAAKLSKTLDPEALLGIVQRTLPELVPPQEMGAVLFALDKKTYSSFWPEHPGEMFQEVAESCQSPKSVVKVDDIQGSQFRRPPFPTCRSFLAVPLASESVSGVILVASTQVGAFSTQDQDALGALAYQAQAILSSCALFEKLKKSQAQLIQASKMAAVGQLSAGIAHELNTPLAAIRIAVQAATLDAKKSHFENCCWKLERAEQAAQNAERIISELLIFSRSSPSKAAPMSLKRVATRAVDMVRPQLSKANVKVVLPEDEVSPVLANETEIHQVVLNLLLNARDAVVSAQIVGPEIALDTAEYDDVVELRVTDNGPGLSEEVIDRVFDPFFTTKPVGKGTGLGLSVSLTLVESYQGTLTVRNQPGGGACFVVRLPKV